MATYWDYPSGSLEFDLIPRIVTEHARRLCRRADIKFPGLKFRNLPEGGVRIETGTRNARLATRIIDLLRKAESEIDADISAEIRGVRIKDGIVYDAETGEPIPDDDPPTVG